MKRIAVGQFLQETNTLNPVATELADFEAWGLARGPAVMERYGSVGELAGFADLPDLLGEKVEWVGLARAVAWSGGPLSVEARMRLEQELLHGLTAAPVDGILLSLHGAQAAADEPDVAGAVLAAVRRRVGPVIPVVATLDLHANVTARMAQSADLLVGYHTFPHVDQYNCGRRAARGLARRLAGGPRPRISAWKIPMVVGTEGRSTDRGIQAALWSRITAAEEEAPVWSVGLYMVQPWFDVPGLGWTLYQAFQGERPPLSPTETAAACWDTRRHREIDYLPPDEVVAAARRIAGGPVIVSESHDATNSGAPGDSPLLLAAFIREEIGEGGGLVFCVDPQAVGRCWQAGTGRELDLEIGGRCDPYSRPLAVRARIEDLGEVRFRLSGHGGHNLPVDMGRMARVRVRDTVVVLVEKTGPGSSPELYRVAGAEPQTFKLVAAKSPEGFRRDYESFAAGILYCAAPGCASPFLGNLAFRSVSRPLFPFDDPASMHEARWAGELMNTEYPDGQR